MPSMIDVGIGLFVFVLLVATVFVAVGPTRHPVININKVRWGTYKTNPKMAKEECKSIQAFVANRPTTVLLGDGSSVELKSYDALTRPQGNQRPLVAHYGWFSLLVER